MQNKQLIDYIKQQFTQGVNEEEIKNNLLNTGWNDADVNEALHFIRPQSQSSRSSNSKLLILAMSLTVIFILAGSGLAYYLFANNEPKITNDMEAQSQQQTQARVASRSEPHSINTETMQEPARESIQDILTKTENIKTVQYEIATHSNLISRDYKVWEMIPYKRFEETKNNLPITPANGAVLFKLIRHSDVVYVSSYTGIPVKVAVDQTDPEESSFLSEFAQRLKENQTLKETGTEMIDGKIARIVEYSTVDEFTQSEIKYKLWLWEEKGTPIQIERYRSRSNEVDTLKKYNNFIFEDIPDSIFEVPIM